MLKKIFGISAIALCAAGAVACSSGSTSETGTNTSAAADAASTGAEDAQAQGTPLAVPDVSADMKAKGEKVDLSAQVEKYKPLVKLAEYKGVKVAKGDVYEMTEEELTEELDMMRESFKKFEDITEGGTTQEGDALTLTAEATLDGQPYEDYTLQDQYYEVGSQLIAEDFDKQLAGKKANEDFEISVTFPADYIDEEMLEEGETSLNGKTLIFKSKISKIERPSEETMNDDWVKNHKEDLAAYSYDNVNTVDELKALIKKDTDENRAKFLLQERGSEALSYVISQSEFTSYPEDELNTLKEQTKSNIQQEYEAYKDMMSVNSLEEYLKNAYEMEGESALDDYATQQAQQYLQNKMAVTLIADAAGIEIGEDDVKALGDEMALYYGFDSYEAMQKQYGDSVRESAVFEALYDKVVSYLGSESDPSLETEAASEESLEIEAETQESTGSAESETSSAG